MLKHNLRLRLLIKWILFAVVVAYVCRQGVVLWNQSAAQKPTLTWGGLAWLGGSALLYLLSWLPSIWLWKALMRSLGGRVSFFDAARAYYCGHLGKYIPGKAMVLVIRAGLVKDRGCRAGVAALTAAYETLVMMGTGLALGVILAPLLFREQIESRAPRWSHVVLLEPLVLLLVVSLIIAASLPFISRLLSWIARKTVADSSLETAEHAQIPSRLLGAGCIAFVLSWTVQGLSLGTTLQALGVRGFNLSDLPAWTAAMALSTAMGFLVLFAPGGLGVREAFLLNLLSSQPGISPQEAVLATVLTRVVSFLSELAISAVLYFGFRPPPLSPSDG